MFDKLHQLVYISGQSQVVRIPKKYRFAADEVYIERDSERVILSPKPTSRDQYVAAAKHFSADFIDSIKDLPREEIISHEYRPDVSRWL